MLYWIWVLGIGSCPQSDRIPCNPTGCLAASACSCHQESNPTPPIFTGNPPGTAWGVNWDSTNSGESSTTADSYFNTGIYGPGSGQSEVCRLAPATPTEVQGVPTGKYWPVMAVGGGSNCPYGMGTLVMDAQFKTTAFFLGGGAAASQSWVDTITSRSIYFQTGWTDVDLGQFSPGSGNGQFESDMWYIEGIFPWSSWDSQTGACQSKFGMQCASDEVNQYCSGMTGWVWKKGFQSGGNTHVYLNYWYENINHSTTRSSGSDSFGGGFNPPSPPVAPQECPATPANNWGLSDVNQPAYNCFPNNNPLPNPSYRWGREYVEQQQAGFLNNEVNNPKSVPQTPENFCRFFGGTDWLGYDKSVPAAQCQWSQIYDVGCSFSSTNKTASEVCPYSPHDYPDHIASEAMRNDMKTWNKLNSPTASCNDTECVSMATSKSFDKCIPIENVTSPKLTGYWQHWKTVVVDVVTSVTTQSCSTQLWRTTLTTAQQTQNVPCNKIQLAHRANNGGFWGSWYRWHWRGRGFVEDINRARWITRRSKCTLSTRSICVHNRIKQRDMQNIFNRYWKRCKFSPRRPLRLDMEPRIRRAYV